jgi:hypothetical protein
MKDLPPALILSDRKKSVSFDEESIIKRPPIRKQTNYGKLLKSNDRCLSSSLDEQGFI